LESTPSFNHLYQFSVDRFVCNVADVLDRALYSHEGLVADQVEVVEVVMWESVSRLSESGDWEGGPSGGGDGSMDVGGMICKFAARRSVGGRSIGVSVGGAIGGISTSFSSLDPSVRPFERELDSQISLRSGTKMSWAPTANTESLVGTFALMAEVVD
jgi:hypothetical protein